MTTKETPATVRKRKGPARATAGHEWEILTMYLDNISEEEIAKQFDVTPKTIKGFITKTIKALNQSYETKQLVHSSLLDQAGKKYYWAPTKALDNDVNKRFIAKLSEGNDPVLTEDERTFCYLLIYEGDAKAALVTAGLDVGILKTMGQTERDRVLELRVTYLKSKPNLISYMRELQTQFVSDFKVSKEAIQAEIWRTIAQLRNQNDPKNAPTIAKLLSDLGRTEGVFVDKTQVDNRFSLDDSFEIMLQRQAELASSETIELALTPSGTYVDPDTLEEESENVELRQTNVA